MLLRSLKYAKLLKYSKALVNAKFNLKSYIKMFHSVLNALPFIRQSPSSVGYRFTIFSNSPVSLTLLKISKPTFQTISATVYDQT